MAKGGREKIKLESTAGTGHFYTTSKNERTTPAKLEFRRVLFRSGNFVPNHRGFTRYLADSRHDWCSRIR